jgi:hypothetical protein
MHENIGVRGIWFLPFKPEAGIPGFLEYTSAKGVELQLMGIFETGRGVDHRPELINGISEDGKRITLYKCSRFQRTFSTNTYETSRYDALYLFVGKHFNSVEELKFENITCVLADFDLWVGAYGFKKIESNDETRKIDIEYERPEDLEFKVTDTINFAIRFNAEYPLGKRRSKATIIQTTGAKIWSNAGTTKFEDLLDWFQSFQRLMTLAYFTRPLIDRVTVGLKEIPDDGEEYISAIDLYFQTDTTKDNYKSISSNNYFLFGYKEVKENFGSILKRWFMIEDLLQPTVAGLTEAFMKRSLPVEFRFLGLAQAIETFHRRTSDDAKYNNEDHRGRLESILNGTSDNYKDWLKERLQYSHEPSLKARLKELAAGIPEPVKKLLCKPSVSKFLNQIRDNRNYYTHYNEDLRSRVVRLSELFILAERMKIFLVCLVLKEIGFTEKEVVKTILGKGVFIFNHIIQHEEAQEVYKEWMKENDDTREQNDQ